MAAKDDPGVLAVATENRPRPELNPETHAEDVSDLCAIEARWSRLEPVPEPTREILDEHLGDWPSLREQRWTLLAGGLRSWNLRSGDRVARIARDGPDSEGARTLEKEAALLERMSEDLCVPRIIALGPSALILEYVPHEPLPATAQAGEAVGRAAARIGRLRFEDAGMLDSELAVAEPFVSALDGLAEWIGGLLEDGAGRRLGPELRSAVVTLLHAARPRLEAAQGEPRLCHSDFKPTNVHWLPERQDVLVLDWEFAWSGPALFDLAMMLRWSPPEPFVAGLVRGYQQESDEPLPDDWRRVTGWWDLHNLLGFLGREDLDPVCEQDVLRRVRELVEA